MANQASIKEEDLRKGPWHEEEDERLSAIVGLLGERRWDALAKASGLKRSGKSCRLRWKNYLRPNLKHGQISAEEEQIILQLHQQWGNKWSNIARRLPGRTDNEIKNYWRCHLRKKALVLAQGNTLHKSEHQPEFLNPICDTGMLTLGSSNSEDNISVVSFYSCDSSLELSNFSSPHSPYEARLSDWFSYWSYEQSEIEHHGDSCSLDSCLCCPAWISENSDANIWNSWDSIWDLA